MSRFRSVLLPLILAAATIDCGQNVSEQPADAALAQRNLTPVGGPAASSMVAGAAAKAAAAEGEGTQWGGIRVDVPEAWQAEAPSSSMRVAQYALPDVGSGTAELAVFGGPMGTVEGNINRWIGQFAAADGGAPTSRRWTQTTSGGFEATMVEVSGTFDGGMGSGGPQTGHAMLGAIVEGAGTVLYLKLTGPQSDIATLPETFEQLVLSMRAG